MIDPGAPPNFDYPRSWTAWRGQPSNQTSNYFDYYYWLPPKMSGSHYAGPCPGHPHPLPNLTNATDGLAGPIAVWCGVDEPDDHFYDHRLTEDTLERMRFGAAQYAKDGTPFYIASGYARPHTPWRVPQRFWDAYDDAEIALAKHKLPPRNMPGVAWQAHSFFNASTGAVFPLNITSPLDDGVARLARRGYYASVSWFDFQVGRILDELEALNIANETVVALHGDHGWQLGEHNSWHKYTNFELGTRVPLIVRTPDISQSKGVIVRGLAELVDVYPTLVDLAGAPAPSDFLDGVSLKPFMRSPERTSMPVPPRLGTLNKSFAFSQYPHKEKGPLCPVTDCPFMGSDGTCHQAPQVPSVGVVDDDATNNATVVGSSSPSPPPPPLPPSTGYYMGFSARNADW